MKYRQCSLCPILLIGLPLVFACGAKEQQSGEECPIPDSATWLASEPSRYVFETCGTGFVPSACTIVVVENGVAVATADAEPDDGFEPLPPESIGTLTDAFATEAQEGSDCGGCEVRLELDEQYGYLKERYLSCGQEGWGTRITCFAPDTTDPSSCR